MPSTPADAKGLLKAAVRDPGPVVVIESLAVWGLKGEVPEGDHLVPIGEARVARAGDDVTIVSWGAAVHRALAAAELLAGEGVSAEVVDLRTLSPLDRGAILRSLERTGRLVVVHDAVGPFGAGAEVAAIAASEGFGSLRAPVRRVTAPFAPVPLGAALEAAYYPQAEGIAEAVREVVG
jgi:pyruvate/2-oxoglutarate/acetoin dehydrogenase E1 component